LKPAATKSKPFTVGAAGSEGLGTSADLLAGAAEGAELSQAMHWTVEF